MTDAINWHPLGTRIKAEANATRWNTFCEAELPRIVQCDKVPCPLRERCIAARIDGGAA